MTVEFPVAERTERWTMPLRGTPVRASVLPFPGGTTHTIKFKGNTLVKLSPPLEPGCWLYQDRPEKYQATKAPMKKVTRYVSPLVLRW